MTEVVVQASRTPGVSGFLFITLGAIAAVAVLWFLDHKRSNN
ncbi:MAG: hypothetical protein R3F58_15795 [Steroidobacteraceae bacterium]